MQIRSNAIDVVGNNLSITQISRLLMCDLAAEKHWVNAEKRTRLTEQHRRVRNADTFQTPSGDLRPPILFRSTPSVSAVTTVCWFQMTFRAEGHRNTQAVTLAGAHFHKQTSGLLQIKYLVYRRVYGFLNHSTGMKWSRHFYWRFFLVCCWRSVWVLCLKLRLSHKPCGVSRAILYIEVILKNMYVAFQQSRLPRGLQASLPPDERGRQCSFWREGILLDMQGTSDLFATGPWDFSLKIHLWRMFLKGRGISSSWRKWKMEHFKTAIGGGITSTLHMWYPSHRTHVPLSYGYNFFVIHRKCSGTNKG